MFILIKTTTHPSRSLMRLFDNREDAIAAAREFVGSHNPIDGCSAEPIETDRAGVIFTISRCTSFGNRRAIVQPIAHDSDAPVSTLV